MTEDDTLHPAVALERGCSDQRGFVAEPSDPFGYMAHEPDAWYRAREQHRNAFRAKHPKHPLPPELMRTTEETHRYLYDDARGFVQEPKYRANHGNNPDVVHCERQRPATPLKESRNLLPCTRKNSLPRSYPILPLTTLQPWNGPKRENSSMNWLITV